MQFHICYKPTNRLAHFASLGIPTIVYPFASYIDILVDFGYPLVAENLDDVRCLGAVWNLAPYATRYLQFPTQRHPQCLCNSGCECWTPCAAAQAALLLDRLVASPQLRQEASAKMLEIGKYLSVEELAEDYEQGLCSFLSPEALELRRVTPEER